MSTIGGAGVSVNPGNTELTAPLELPAEPGKPLTTQGGNTLDDGSGTVSIGGGGNALNVPNGNATVGGTAYVGTVSCGGDVAAEGHINPGYAAAALPTNPPASGTVYQNTTGGPIQIALPVTGGTAADTAQWALGSTDTPGDWGGADTVAASEVKTLHLTVPNDWYWSITTGATIGTADVLGS